MVCSDAPGADTGKQAGGGKPGQGRPAAFPSWPGWGTALYPHGARLCVQWADGHFTS